MGKMNGAGGACGGGVNDSGVVTNRGDLIFRIEGEDHGVVEKRFSRGGLRAVPLKTVLQDGTGFHFSARSEKFGQLVEADLEQWIPGGFDQVKSDAAKIGLG